MIRSEKLVSNGCGWLEPGNGMHALSSTWIPLSLTSSVHSHLGLPASLIDLTAWPLIFDPGPTHREPQVSELERTPAITIFMQRIENGGGGLEFLSTFPGSDQNSYHHTSDYCGLGTLCMSWQQILTPHYGQQILYSSFSFVTPITPMS